MAKHHPDLIFCRKQPGVGTFSEKPESPKCKQTISINSSSLSRFQQSADSAKSAMESVSSATRMCVLVLWSGSAMNVITGLIKDGV